MREGCDTAAAAAAADGAGRSPRVLCMVFTTLENWDTRGHAVRNTWARRCDAYRYVTTGVRPEPTSGFNSGETLSLDRAEPQSV